jgi:hypothetical protein
MFSSALIAVAALTVAGCSSSGDDAAGAADSTDVAVAEAPTASTAPAVDLSTPDAAVDLTTPDTAVDLTTADTAVDLTTAEPATTVDAGSDVMFPDGLRDVRYCEVLLLTQPAADFVAEVWNTMGYSDCPQADWEALDAAAIAADNGAVAAVLNGPRHWTLDQIVSTIRDEAPTRTFGAIEMFRAATTDLGPTIPDQSPFVERVIARDTIFRFRAGSQVYELTSPTGKRYVMQSYSQKLDPTQTIDTLAALGSVLQLPAGWAFTSEVLTADLDVLSDSAGLATVIQDEFQNTYQLIS